jgi:hypothetical protein
MPYANPDYEKMHKKAHQESPGELLSDLKRLTARGGDPDPGLTKMPFKAGKSLPQGMRASIDNMPDSLKALAKKKKGPPN